MNSNEQEGIAVDFFRFELHKIGLQIDPCYVWSDARAIGRIFANYGFPQLNSLKEILMELLSRGCQYFTVNSVLEWFGAFLQGVLLYNRFEGVRSEGTLACFASHVDMLYVQYSALQAYQITGASRYDAASSATYPFGAFSTYEISYFDRNSLARALRVVFSDAAANESHNSNDESGNGDNNCGELYEYLLRRERVFVCADLTDLSGVSDVAAEIQLAFLLHYYAEAGALDSYRAVDMAKRSVCAALLADNQQCLAKAYELQHYVVYWRNVKRAVLRINTGDSRAGQPLRYLTAFLQDNTLSAVRDRLRAFLSFYQSAYVLALQAQACGAAIYPEFWGVGPLDLSSERESDNYVQGHLDFEPEQFLACLASNGSGCTAFADVGSGSKPVFSESTIGDDFKAGSVSGLEGDFGGPIDTFYVAVPRAEHVFTLAAQVQQAKNEAVCDYFAAFAADLGRRCVVQGLYRCVKHNFDIELPILYLNKEAFSSASLPTYQELASYLIRNTMQRIKQRELSALGTKLCELVKLSAPGAKMQPMPSVAADEQKLWAETEDLLSYYLQYQQERAEHAFASEFVDFFLEFVRYLLFSGISNESKQVVANNFLSYRQFVDLVAGDTARTAKFNSVAAEARKYGYREQVGISLLQSYEIAAHNLSKTLNSQADRIAAAASGSDAGGLSCSQIAGELQNIMVDRYDVAITQQQMSDFFSQFDKCIWNYAKMKQIEQFRGLEYDQREVDRQLSELERLQQSMTDIAKTVKDDYLGLGCLHLTNKVNQQMSQVLLENQLACAQKIDFTKDKIDLFKYLYFQAITILQRVKDTRIEHYYGVERYTDVDQLYAACDRLRQASNEIERERDVSSGQSCFLDLVNELIGLLFDDFLLKTCISPLLFLSSISFLLQLLEEWDSQAAQLGEVLAKYQTALQCCDLTEDIWKSCEENTKQVARFNALFAEMTQQSGCATESRVNYLTIEIAKLENKSGTFYSNSHDTAGKKRTGTASDKVIEMMTCYEQVQGSGDFLDLLLDVQQLLSEYLSTDLKNSCPALRNKINERQQFVAQFKRNLTQFDAVLTDYLPKKSLYDEEIVLDLSGAKRDIGHFCEICDDLSRRLIEVIESPATTDMNYQWQNLIELSIQIEAYSRVVDIARGSIDKRTFQKPPQSEISNIQLNMRRIAQTHRLSEDQFNKVMQRISEYEDEASNYEYIRSNLDELQKAFKASRQQCADHLNRVLCRINTGLADSYPPEALRNDAKTLLDTAQNLMKAPAVKCMYAPLEPVFGFINNVLESRDKRNAIQKHENANFDDFYDELFKYIQESFQDIAKKLFQTTKRGMELREKYTRDPSPDELLEYQQILRYCDFLDSLCTTLEDLTDNRKLSEQLRQMLSGLGQRYTWLITHPLKLPLECDIRQDLAYAKSNIYVLKQVDITTLELQSGTVLQYFIFEDVKIEYESQRELSCRMDDSSRCYALLHEGATVFGLQGVAVNLLRRVLTFNDYCDSVIAVLDQSVYGKAIKQDIIYLDYKPDICNIIREDVRISYFCKEFDAKCQAKIQELMAGHTCVVDCSADQFAERETYCYHYGTAGFPEQLVFVMAELAENVHAYLYERYTQQLRSLKTDQAMFDSCGQILLQCSLVVRGLGFVDMPRWKEFDLATCESAICTLAQNIVYIMASLEQMRDQNSDIQVRQQTLQICESMRSLCKKLDAQFSDLYLMRGVGKSEDATFFCENFINLVHTCFLARESIQADVSEVLVHERFRELYGKMADLAKVYQEKYSFTAYRYANRRDDQAVRELCASVYTSVSRAMEQFIYSSSWIIRDIILKVTESQSFEALKSDLLKYADFQLVLFERVNTELPRLLEICNSPLLLEQVHRPLLSECYATFLLISVLGKTVKQLVIGYQQAKYGVTDSNNLKDAIKKLADHHEKRMGNCYDIEAAQEALDRMHDSVKLILSAHFPRLQSEINTSCQLMDEMVFNLKSAYAEHFNNTQLLTMQVYQQVAHEYQRDAVQREISDIIGQSPTCIQRYIKDFDLPKHAQASAKPLGESLLGALCQVNVCALKMLNVCSSGQNTEINVNATVGVTARARSDAIGAQDASNKLFVQNDALYSGKNIALSGSTRQPSCSQPESAVDLNRLTSCGILGLQSLPCVGANHDGFAVPSLPEFESTSHGIALPALYAAAKTCTADLYQKAVARLHDELAIGAQRTPEMLRPFDETAYNARKLLRNVAVDSIGADCSDPAGAVEDKLQQLADILKYCYSPPLDAFSKRHERALCEFCIAAAELGPRLLLSECARRTEALRAELQRCAENAAKNLHSALESIGDALRGAGQQCSGPKSENRQEEEPNVAFPSQIDALCAMCLYEEIYRRRTGEPAKDSASEPEKNAMHASQPLELYNRNYSPQNAASELNMALKNALQRYPPRPFAVQLAAFFDVHAGASTNAGAVIGALQVVCDHLEGMIVIPENAFKARFLAARPLVDKLANHAFTLLDRKTGQVLQESCRLNALFEAFLHLTRAEAKKHATEYQENEDLAEVQELCHEAQNAVLQFSARALGHVLPLYCSGCYANEQARTDYLDCQAEELCELLNGGSDSAFLAVNDVATQLQEAMCKVGDSTASKCSPTARFGAYSAILSTIANSALELYEMKKRDLSAFASKFAEIFDTCTSFSESADIISKMAGFLINSSFIEPIEGENDVLFNTRLELDYIGHRANTPLATTLVYCMREAAKCYTAECNKTAKLATVKDHSLMPDNSGLEFLLAFIQGQLNLLKQQVSSFSNVYNSLSFILAHAGEIYTSGLRYKTLFLIFSASGIDLQAPALENLNVGDSRKIERALEAVQPDSGVFRVLCAETYKQLELAALARENIDYLVDAYDTLVDFTSLRVRLHAECGKFMKQAQQIGRYNALSDILSVLADACATFTPSYELAEIMALAHKKDLDFGSSAMFCSMDIAQAAHLQECARLAYEFLGDALRTLTVGRPLLELRDCVVACESAQQHYYSLNGSNQNRSALALPCFNGEVGKCIKAGALTFAAEPRYQAAVGFDFLQAEYRFVACASEFEQVYQSAKSYLERARADSCDKAGQKRAVFLRETQAELAERFLAVLQHNGNANIEFQRWIAAIANYRLIQQIKKNCDVAMRYAKFSEEIGRLEEATSRFLCERLGENIIDRLAAGNAIVETQYLERWEAFVRAHIPQLRPGASLVVASKAQSVLPSSASRDGRRVV